MITETKYLDTSIVLYEFEIVWEKDSTFEFCCPYICNSQEDSILSYKISAREQII